jgi:hypothetical protein
MSPDDHTLAWVPEVRAAALVGVSRSTFRGWVKAGLVQRQGEGAFSRASLVEAVVVAELRGVLPLHKVRHAMDRMREGDELVRLVERAALRGTGEPERVDVAVDVGTGDVTLCTDDASLVSAVRPRGVPVTLTVIPLASKLRRARRGFDFYAHPGPPPAHRRRGRPPRRSGRVTSANA